MGRPLKIQKLSPGSSISGSSVTVDAGFPNFNSLDQGTVVEPTGMTGTEYLGVVGGSDHPASATATNPIVAIVANVPGGEGNAYIITQKGQTKYLVSGVDTVAATAITPGFSYMITALGTTNWTAIGAGVNPQVGDVFTALKVGTGTGTASDCDQAYLIGGLTTPVLASGQMYISFTPDGGTTTLYATKLTNKYIWDSATPPNKYAVNFFTSGVTTAGSGAEKATWSNGTGNYELAEVANYTS